MANLSNINGKFVVEQTTGYVGVGTTDPNYPIEVLNASAEIALNASGASIYRLRSDSTDYFRINKNGVGDRLVISGGGDVGIGISVPTTKLHIGGAAPGDSIIRQDSTVSGTNWEIGERAAGKWQIFEDDGDTIVATFMSSGNVGIGTASPSRKLVVAQSDVTEPSGIDANASILIKNNTWSGIQMISTEATGNFITFGDNVNGFAGRIQYSHATNAMQFETLGSEKMRIDSSGKMIIPAIADGIKFEITSSAGSGHGIIEMGQVGSDGFLDVSAAGGGIVTHLSGYTGYASYFLSTVGVGTASPSSYDAEGDDLVIYNAVTPGITIALPQTTAAGSARGSILFSDGTSGGERYRGGVIYDHGTGMGGVADTMYIRSAINNYMVLGPTGNVGIGTVTPQKKLHIEGTGGASEMQFLVSSASDTVGHTAGIGLRGEGGESDGDLRIKGGIFFERIAGSFGNGKMILAVNSSVSNTSVTVADHALTIDTNKNVGIGTTSPGQKLAIEGGGTADESVLRVNNQGQVSSRIWLRNAGQSGYIFNSGSTGDTLASGIATQGFGMGINNNSPIQFYNGSAASVKLTIDVDGVANFTGPVIAGTTSDYTDGVGAVVGNSPAGDNGGIVDLHANGSHRYYTRIAHGATGSGSAGYWHIKTNMKPSDSVMFLAKFYGYIYGQSSIVDLQHSGYAYAGSNSVIAQGAINNGSTSGMSSAIYLTANLEVCFRIDLVGSTYYAGLWMDVGLQNPTGGTHILKILGSTFSTTTNYYT